MVSRIPVIKKTFLNMRIRTPEEGLWQNVKSDTKPQDFLVPLELFVKETTHQLMQGVNDQPCK